MPCRVVSYFMTPLCLKIEKWLQKLKFEKNLVEKKIITKILKKKNSRQLRGRGFWKYSDITAHLFHDRNTSIALSCTVFNFPSAGNDPGWINWTYEFLFFRPWGLWTRRPAQTGPWGQNPAFQRFDPMILCSFLWRFRKTALESHNSKQMVYDQITSFIKKSKFYNFVFWPLNRFFDWKINLSIKKPKKTMNKP